MSKRLLVIVLLISASVFVLPSVAYATPGECRCTNSELGAGMCNNGEFPTPQTSYNNCFRACTKEPYIPQEKCFTSYQIMDTIECCFENRTYTFTPGALWSIVQDTCSKPGATADVCQNTDPDRCCNTTTGTVLENVLSSTECGTTARSWGPRSACRIATDNSGVCCKGGAQITAANETICGQQQGLWANECVGGSGAPPPGGAGAGGNQTGTGTGTTGSGSGAGQSGPFQPTRVSLPNPLGTTNLTVLIGRVIAALMSIVGSLALLMFIYGGFLWMTARGNGDEVKKGKSIIVWSVAGLLLIFSAYIILKFIFGRITGAITGT